MGTYLIHCMQFRFSQSYAPMALSATNLLCCCGMNPCNECMYAHNPLKVQSSHVMSAVANRQKKACDTGGGNTAMWEKKMLLLMELAHSPMA